MPHVSPTVLEAGAFRTTWRRCRRETRQRRFHSYYDATSIIVPPDGKPKINRRQMPKKSFALPAEAIYN
jgi:hypothetical protein